MNFCDHQRFYRDRQFLENLTFVNHCGDYRHGKFQNDVNHCDDHWIRFYLSNDLRLVVQTLAFHLSNDQSLNDRQLICLVTSDRCQLDRLNFVLPFSFLLKIKKGPPCGDPF